MGRWTKRWTDKEAGGQKDGFANRQRSRLTEQKDKRTYRKTDIQTDRQACGLVDRCYDRKTYNQTDKLAGR